MNILIIEDEKKTAVLLRDMIETHGERLVVNVCESIEESVVYLFKNQSKLDLIFMDIQLADGLSFEIFNQVQITIPVVFCTAYDDYTLKAFKNNGIDYILKPFKEEDIEQAFSKVELLKANFSTTTFDSAVFKNLLYPEPVLQTSFLVRYREKMIPLSVSDIAFVWLENEMVSLLNFKGEKYQIAKTLEQIEQAVSTKNFFRINRQMIVSRTAIKDIEPYFNRKVVVHLNVSLPEKAIVSRLKVSPFLEWIEIPQ
jgi:two-component system, LytTR family, response regulator LytT